MSPSFIKQYPAFQYVEQHGLTEPLRHKLSGDFHIQEDDIDDIFSPTQLSKFEIRRNYAYFALQLAGSDEKNSIIIQQIHCLISKKYLIVIDEDGFEGIRDFDKQRNILVSKNHYNSFDLFYELLDLSVIHMFQLLSMLHLRVKTLEMTIFSDDTL